MIKKRLALEAARLREDELELEVPPDLVAGRLGGAHSLQRISGSALASRLEWISVGESLCWFGAGLPRPGLTFSLCLAASGSSPSMRRAVRLASRGLVFGSPLPRAAPPKSPC